MFVFPLSQQIKKIVIKDCFILFYFLTHYQKGKPGEHNVLSFFFFFSFCTQMKLLAQQCSHKAIGGISPGQ
jgi:hypothetical protein